MWLSEDEVEWRIDLAVLDTRMKRQVPYIAPVEEGHAVPSKDLEIGISETQGVIPQLVELLKTIQILRWLPGKSFS